MRGVKIPTKKGRLAYQRAQRWLQGAVRAFDDKRWDNVIYNSQMAVEHAIKAILLNQGLIFKRVHDVSDEFLALRNHEALPKEIQTNIDKLSDTLIYLTDQRALAGYGFEEEVDLEFFREPAPKALKKAQWALKTIGIMFSK
ncbi:MAG: HEPN domain-containing protein [Candidatus Thorarchaeota archaeon]